MYCYMDSSSGYSPSETGVWKEGEMRNQFFLIIETQVTTDDTVAGFGAIVCDKAGKFMLNVLRSLRVGLK